MQKAVKENIQPEPARGLAGRHFSDVMRKRQSDSPLSCRNLDTRPAKSPKGPGYTSHLETDKKGNGTVKRKLAGQTPNKRLSPGPPLRCITKDFPSAKNCTPNKRTSIYGPTGKCGNSYPKQHQDVMTGVQTPKRGSQPIADFTPKRVLKSQQISEGSSKNANLFTPRQSTLSSLKSDSKERGANKDSPVFTPRHVLNSQQYLNASPDKGISSKSLGIFTPQRTPRSQVSDISGPGRTGLVRDSLSFTPQRVLKSTVDILDETAENIGRTDASTSQHVGKPQSSAVYGVCPTTQSTDVTGTPIRVPKPLSLDKSVSNLGSLTPQRVVKSRLSDISGPARLIRNNDGPLFTPQRVIKTKVSCPTLFEEGIKDNDGTTLQHGLQSQPSKTTESYSKNDHVSPQLDIMCNPSIYGANEQLSTMNGLAPECGESQYSDVSDPDESDSFLMNSLPTVGSQLQKCQENICEVERLLENQGKLTGYKKDSYRGEKCVGNSDDQRAEGLKEEETPATIHSPHPPIPTCITPDMQLPVVINPVDTSDNVTTEMPNTASQKWIKSQPETSLREKLCTTDRIESPILIGPIKTCDMPAANQSLLDRIKQRLERKLKESGESTPKETFQLNKGITEPTEIYLNSKNNNEVSCEDYCTYEPFQTAGQSNRNFSQGLQIDSNANDIAPFTIYSDSGNTAVTTSSIIEGSSNTDHILETSKPYVTYMENSVENESGILPKSHHLIETPFQLRKRNTADKVVSPLIDNYDLNSETFDKSNVELLDNEVEQKIAAAISTPDDVKLYAPTPIVKRQSGTQYTPDGKAFNSNFPLMTPLALKNVAKQQQVLRSDSPNKCTDSKMSLDNDATSFIGNVKQQAQLEHLDDISLNETDDAEDTIEDWTQETVLKTPPSKKSAFVVVEKSSLTPLVGSLSLRGNTIGKVKRSKVIGRSKERGPKQMYLSIHERYHDALLDEEVTRFALRLVAEHTGYFPRSCSNPVAKILMEGDDMHFIPIDEVQTDMASSPYIPGSAFSKYSVGAD